MIKKPRSHVLSHTERVLPRLPHPSWHWALAGDGADRSAVKSADDFWSRLGL